MFFIKIHLIIDACKKLRNYSIFNYLNNLIRVHYLEFKIPTALRLRKGPIQKYFSDLLLIYYFKTYRCSRIEKNQYSRIKDKGLAVSQKSDFGVWDTFVPIKLQPWWQIRDGRVQGNLAVSRAFGDFQLWIKIILLKLIFLI